MINTEELYQSCLSDIKDIARRYYKGISYTKCGNIDEGISILNEIFMELVIELNKGKGNSITCLQAWMKVSLRRGLIKKLIKERKIHSYEESVDNVLEEYPSKEKEGVLKSLQELEGDSAELADLLICPSEDMQNRIQRSRLPKHEATRREARLELNRLGWNEERINKAFIVAKKTLYNE